MTATAIFRHGTFSGYQRHGCKCQECRSFWAAYMLKQRHKRRAILDKSNWNHGTVSTYTNYGCRCVPCSDANRKQSHRYYEEHRAEIRAAARAERVRQRLALDASLVARSTALDAARKACTGELASLIYDQTRDERRFRINRAPYHYSWDDVYRSSEAGGVARRCVPDFSDLVDAVIDARREIDAYAEDAA